MLRLAAWGHAGASWLLADHCHGCQGLKIQPWSPTGWAREEGTCHADKISLTWELGTLIISRSNKKHECLKYSPHTAEKCTSNTTVPITNPKDIWDAGACYIVIPPSLKAAAARNICSTELYLTALKKSSWIIIIILNYCTNCKH